VQYNNNNNTSLRGPAYTGRGIQRIIIIYTQQLCRRRPSPAATRPMKTWGRPTPQKSLGTLRRCPSVFSYIIYYPSLGQHRILFVVNFRNFFFILAIYIYVIRIQLRWPLAFTCPGNKLNGLLSTYTSVYR